MSNTDSARLGAPMGRAPQRTERRMKLQDQLAEAILEALNEEGLTQAEFARTLGVTTKHINQLVQGKSGALGLFDYEERGHR